MLSEIMELTLEMVSCLYTSMISSLGSPCECLPEASKVDEAIPLPAKTKQTTHVRA